MVDIEELKRFQRRVGNINFRNRSKTSGPVSYQKLEVIAGLAVNHLPAIIAELESLREAARKPDARRLAVRIVHETPWDQLSWSECVNYATSIIEREFGSA